MIDFSEITLIKNPNDNFVGIRKSESGDNYEFWLPNGFNDFVEGDFDKVRDLFFKMYRTFRKFEDDNKPNRININREDYQTDQDQTTISSGGLSLETAEGESCQLYSKLNMIERVLETYDDLLINAIQKKVKRTEDIDYSQIHKYLDRAIYLDNDVVYVETMDLPRPVLRYESTDIVNLYCYILDEIIQQLQDDVPDNIKALTQDIRFLGQNFKDSYLTSDQSIFHKDTFLETTIILKETLDNIDKNTYYKDPDYWVLYEAIETFLYGQLNPDINDGNYWGIKGFSLIWEDMCQTYFFRNHLEKICYADTDIPLKGYYNHSRRQQEESNRVGNLQMTVSDGINFCKQWIYSAESDVSDNDNQILRWHELLVVEFNPNPRHLVLTDGAILHPYYDYLDYGYDLDYKQTRVMTKYLRPDLVLLDNSKVQIVDYKDVPLEFYLNPSNLSPKEHNKYKHDVIK
ncbi:hypothetical protein NIES22_12550 [Calothrix brevissima NIES-22]|nr:hypothetical protein NIES22_12550 [Calothrix brevissima NIES-22]